MVKIVKQFNLSDAISESNGRRKQKRLKPITLDMLHTNQPHELAQHLKYDNAHRLLPKFRANARQTHPSMLGQMAEQEGNQ
jgi:hypothetical protein